MTTLTPREREVMALVCQGYESKQIGRALGISPRTVDVFRMNVYRKLGANNAAHAAVLFERMK